MNEQDERDGAAIRRFFAAVNDDHTLIIWRSGDGFICEVEFNDHPMTDAREATIAEAVDTARRRLVA